MGVNNAGEQQWGAPFLKLNRRRKKSTRFKMWLISLNEFFNLIYSHIMATQILKLTLRFASTLLTFQ